MNLIQKTAAFLPLTGILLFTGCNESEFEVQNNPVQTELLGDISSESYTIFEASFKDFSGAVSDASLDELATFNSLEISSNSVLKHSNTSDLLSPHMDKFDEGFAREKSFNNARVKAKQSFTSEEQPYADLILASFDLLPDLELFLTELSDIESKIKADLEGDSELKLLTICKSSSASVLFMFENKKEIQTFIQENRARVQASTPNGRTSECCFEGENKFEWSEFGGAVVGTAVTGGFAGATAGSAPLGTLIVPGWVAGTVGGALLGGLGYTSGRFFEWMVSKPVGRAAIPDDPQCPPELEMYGDGDCFEEGGEQNK